MQNALKEGFPSVVLDIFLERAKHTIPDSVLVSLSSYVVIATFEVRLRAFEGHRVCLKELF